MGKIAHVDIGEGQSKVEWEANTSHSIGGVASLEIVRTATRVVAASNASASCRAMADYVCDGTADNVEIQAAIDGLPAGGGRIILSAGQFYIAADILIHDDYVTIEGQTASVTAAGFGGTWLRASATVTSIIHIDSSCAVTISRLGIYGRATTTNGIYISSDIDPAYVANYGKISDVLCEYCTNGITLDNAMCFEFDNVHCWYNDYGLLFITDGTTSSNFNTFIHCGFRRNNLYAVYVNDTEARQTSTTFYACIFESNKRYAVYLYDVQSWNFNDCYFENNNIEEVADIADIVVLNGARCLSIVNCYFASGTTKYCIRIADSEVRIEGNKVGTHAVTRDLYINGITIGVIAANHFADALLNCKYLTVESNEFLTLSVGSSADKLTFINNYFTNTPVVDGSATNLKWINNKNYVTENSGTATLLNANTSVVVAHGCSKTPTYISITWAENPTNVISDWWVDTIGATNFTLNGVDPGASNLDFMWSASVK